MLTDDPAAAGASLRKGGELLPPTPRRSADHYRCLRSAALGPVDHERLCKVLPRRAGGLDGSASQTLAHWGMPCHRLGVDICRE